jgi:hypothetical protein
MPKLTIKSVFLFVSTAITNNPFNTFTVAIAFFAALFAGLSWWEARAARIAADASSGDQIAKMGEQVEQMKIQVAQMNRAAKAQEDNSRYTGQLANDAERNAHASETNAKTSQKSLEIVVQHYAQERLPNLQVNSVVAMLAPDHRHTATTLAIKNMGGSAATNISFEVKCDIYDGSMSSEGHAWYQERASEECADSQTFYKALIGRDEEFDEQEDFYPSVPVKGMLQVYETVMYHAEDKSKFTLSKCYYVGPNYRVADCDIGLDIRRIKK